MQLPPASVLATFPTPNFIDPVTRGSGVLLLTIILFPPTLLIVILRLFTRLHLSRTFGLDDIILLLACIPTAAFAVLSVLGEEKWHWNRHAWDMDPADAVWSLKMSMVLECVFGVATACTKVSLLVLVWRVMGRGGLRWAAIGGMVFVGCEMVVWEVLVINNCSPISDYWTLSTTPQHCIDERASILVFGIINTISDFYVFFLPIPTVFRLPIPFRQQLMLFFLFSIGLIVCASGVVRIYYAWGAFSTYDRTWLAYPVWIASLLELYLGIMCTALPATKPFFSVYLPSLFGHKHSSAAPPPPRASLHRVNPLKQNPYPYPNSNAHPYPSMHKDKSTPLSSIADLPSAHCSQPRLPGSSTYYYSNDNHNTTNDKHMLPLSYLSRSPSGLSITHDNDTTPSSSITTSNLDLETDFSSFLEQSRQTADSNYTFASQNSTWTTSCSFIAASGVYYPEDAIADDWKMSIAHSKRSSRFAESLYELPDLGAGMRDTRLRHTESCEVLLSEENLRPHAM